MNLEISIAAGDRNLQFIFETILNILFEKEDLHMACLPVAPAGAWFVFAGRAFGKCGNGRHLVVPGKPR